jgi:hypothetical protein
MTKPVLVEFQGMRTSALSVLRNPRNDKMLKFLRGEIARNMEELGRRYYAGDLSAVDEFLQCFSIGRDERAALVAKLAADAKVTP